MLIDKKITELKLQPSAVMAEKKMGFHGPLKPGIIHGARHIPTGATNGWYIWQGENDGSKDFFQGRHAVHVIQEYPDLAKYLMLPEGYAFLIDTTNGHEDIWFDEKLLVA